MSCLFSCFKKSTNKTHEKDNYDQKINEMIEILRETNANIGMLVVLMNNKKKKELNDANEPYLKDEKENADSYIDIGQN